MRVQIEPFRVVKGSCEKMLERNQQALQRARIFVNEYVNEAMYYTRLSILAKIYLINTIKNNLINFFYENKFCNIIFIWN